MNNKLTSEEEKMVLENIRLVPYMLKKMRINYGVNNYEDLEQIGYIGLVKAAKTFDKEKSKFVTYATRCIKNEVLMSFRKVKVKNLIYLQDEFFVDDRDSLTYEEIIEDENARFTESFFECEFLEEVLCLILNCFKKQDCIIMLYTIAGLKQEKIAKSLNLSQSYISKSRTRIRKTLNLMLQKNASIDKVKYQICFLKESSIIKFVINSAMYNYSKIDCIKRKIESMGLKVSCTNNKIIINFPKDKESFYLIAQIIQIVEQLD